MATVVGCPEDGYNLINIESQNLDWYGRVHFDDLPSMIVFFSTFVTMNNPSQDIIEQAVKDSYEKETRPLSKIMKDLHKKDLIREIRKEDTGHLIDFNNEETAYYLDLTPMVSKVFDHLMAGGQEDDLKVSNLLTKIKDLEKELQTYKNMVEYAPGGSGYEETKTRYEDNEKKNILSKKEKEEAKEIPKTKKASASTKAPSSAKASSSTKAPSQTKTKATTTEKPPMKKKKSSATTKK